MIIKAISLLCVGLFEANLYFVTQKHEGWTGFLTSSAFLPLSISLLSVIYLMREEIYIVVFANDSSVCDKLTAYSKLYILNFTYLFCNADFLFAFNKAFKP